MYRTYKIEKLPRAFPILVVTGKIRSQPEDFIVDEELDFAFTGTGEHVMLQIRKTARNTDDIARVLARFAEIPRKSVSYAGLKDKKAVTTQYFSVHLPGKQDPDWKRLEDSSLEVLSVTRHQKKLKRGTLSRNKFCLRIREFSGDRDIAEQRLQQIVQEGIPNYFTSQRFGHNANNLLHAKQVLETGKRIKDRFKRNIYYSAARSWLFNLILAERVRRDDWNRAIPGDAMMLNGSRSCFRVEVVDDEINERVRSFDISPTAPLWGKGEVMAASTAADIENIILSDWQDWMQGLERARMNMARRSLRVSLPDLTWHWPENDQLMLTFSLPPGSYATAVLRELGDFTEPTPLQYTT